MLKSGVKITINMVKEKSTTRHDKVAKEIIKYQFNCGINTITEICNDIHNTGYMF